MRFLAFLIMGVLPSVIMFSFIDPEDMEMLGFFYAASPIVLALPYLFIDCDD